MRPIQLFLVLLAIGFLSLVTMIYFPSDGIRINDEITLRFASLDDFNNNEEGLINVEDFLNQYEINIDSTAIFDSIERAKIAYHKEMLRIQWPEDDRSSLEHFLGTLKRVKKGEEKKVRVMHFGDSQIEGDRITSFIRNKRY